MVLDFSEEAMEKEKEQENIIKLKIIDGHIIWIFKKPLINGYKYFGYKVKKVKEDEN